MARGGRPGLSPRSASSLVLAGTAVLALAVRLVPVLNAGAMRSALSYDEGVHLTVAQRLLAGQLPYRDLLFVHPPGVVIAEVPLALLARVVGEPTALAVGRLVVMLMGTLTAVLVARLLLDRGLVAAGTGGVVAALFGPAVAADRVMLLETALSLGLVIALGALAVLGPPDGLTVREHDRRWRRALMIGGIALGLATSVKVWALLDVVLLTAVVVLRHGWPAGRRWLAWCAGTIAVVVVPFALAGPAQMWNAVVLAQLNRPRADGLSLQTMVDRVAVLGPFGSWHRDWSQARVTAVGVGVLVALALAVAMALLVLARRRTRAPDWPDSVWWPVIGGVHGIALVLAPSHYLHYDAFLTVPVALVLGVVAGWAAQRVAARRVEGRGRAVALVASLTGLLVALSLTIPAPTPGPLEDRAVLVEEAGSGCVWTREVQFLLVADLSRRQIAAGCPGQPDLFGILMATGSSASPDAARAAVDARVRTELAGSQAAFLLATKPFDGLGPQSRAYLIREFTPELTTGRVQVWKRSG